MRITALLFSFILSIYSFTVLAGSGHDHGHSHDQTPVTQDQVKVNAAKFVSGLVEKKSLETSWASIKPKSIEEKVFKGQKEWVAVFVNNKISDPAKRTLYIFMTLGGKYIAANYTGK